MVNSLPQEQVLQPGKRDPLADVVTTKPKRFEPTWYKTIAAYGSSNLRKALWQTTEHVYSLLPPVGADVANSSEGLSVLDHSRVGAGGGRNDGPYLHSLP